MTVILSNHHCLYQTRGDSQSIPLVCQHHHPQTHDQQKHHATTQQPQKWHESGQMLRDHRGMRLTRRIKAIFWWCYMHTEHPLPPAQILKVMPTDTQIEQAWQQVSHDHPAAGTIPQWGDAIAWHELHHHTTPHTNPWD